MRVGIISDIHLEFGDIEIPKEENLDVVILAGDIVMVNNWEKEPLYEKFFEKLSKDYKHIVYVMGNHEHYRGVFPKTESILREHLKKWDNVHLLEDQIIHINGYNIMGCTLWTSLNCDNPIVTMTAREYMNDYRMIRSCNEGNYFKLKPIDTMRTNMRSKHFIDENINMDNVIVVTHHSPSLQGIVDTYKGQLLNYAYHNDYDGFICDHENIKLWVHGHVHDSLDYMINNTRVVCNPRGYLTKYSPIEWKLKVVDLD